MSIFDPQNPGIGGLDELTSGEETLLDDLTAISHGAGALIQSDGTSWVALTTGTAGQVLQTTANGVGWTTIAAGGNVVGPAASSGNAIAVYSGTGGTTLLNTGIFVNDSDNVYPRLNNVSQLGAAVSAFADLFLGDGAVINFNNGDVTLTHGANVLTLAGGGIDFGSGSMTNVNIDSGTIDGITDLAVLDGGTGASTAGDARTNLGLVIGTDIQAFDQGLSDVAGLSTADGNFVVGDGTNWVAESGATVRTSLGLGTGDSPQFTRIGLGAAAQTSAEVNLASGGNIIVNNARARRTIVLSGAGGIAATTSACASPATTSANSTTDFIYMAYDPTNEEVGFWNVVMPDNYDGGNVFARFYWTTTATSGNVVWSISGVSLGDGETLNTAEATEITFGDAVTTATGVLITGETSAITINGANAGDWAQFRVHRKPTDAGDDMSADARLLAVKVEYLINAYSD